MEMNQITIIITLLCASVIVLIIPAVIYCIRRIIDKTTAGAYKKSSVSAVLVFSAFLICSVWCLRYAVGYYSIITHTGKDIPLTWWEEIFNSIIHALRTFSMDEEYTDYIINGKIMVGQILGAGSIWENVYGFYASLLNVMAPVAGGAILFEILTSVFPNIKLSMQFWVFWKSKYYFSKLNDASLALAKSIYKAKRLPFTKPVFVFTDVYVDSDNEKEAERLFEARLLGAICVRNDICHIRKNRLGKRKFFLIDENESANLSVLPKLADMRNKVYLKGSEIYLFTNDDSYVQVEKNIYTELEKEFGFKDSELPMITPVKSYRNLVSNLLGRDIPLYEPLIGKRRDCDGKLKLTVTVLGTGHIGTEMFLTTYWMGQILDCKLNINVVSQETESEFWSKIDYINPEIRHTTEKDDPILCINRKGDKSEEYCKVRYLQCDVKSSEFVKLLTAGGNEFNVLDTDYFFVSLGSDEENISVANTVRKYVGQHHIEKKSADRAVIAYVVYDSALTGSLNVQKHFTSFGDKTDIYMQAIGSLNEVYSAENIFMTKYEPFVWEAYSSYNTRNTTKERVKLQKARIKSDYDYWATLAKVLHIQYKVFSLGLIEDSLFDYPKDKKQEYETRVQKSYDRFKSLVEGKAYFDNNCEKHVEMLHRMAWLEHRRWCAFTRVMGFRRPADFTVYAVPGTRGAHKQMDLKLHPCLVECDEKGIDAIISTTGEIDESSFFKSARKKKEDRDLLDDLSYKIYDNKYYDTEKEFGDFKYNDYLKKSGKL